MVTAELRGLLESPDGLTPRQRESLLRALEGEGEEIFEGVDEAVQDGIGRPHCQASRVVRWSQTLGIGRWRCKECGRTYTALAYTPLWFLRLRRRWADLTGSAQIHGLLPGSVGAGQTLLRRSAKGQPQRLLKWDRTARNGGGSAGNESGRSLKKPAEAIRSNAMEV